MKKQLTGLLALLMGFACFAGCGGGGGKDDSTDAPGSSVETPAYELEAAKQAIYGLYPTKAEGREDYELPNSFEVNGVVYTLAWSTNATAADGIELDAGTETTYVNVNTGLAADVDYNLTAKLTAPDGTSIDIPFKRTLKAAPTAVIGTITQAPAADQAYKLYMYQSLKKYDLFFTGKMSGFYLATTNSSNGETYVDGVDVYAVAVDGKDGVYNLSFTSPEDSTTQYIGVKNTYNNGSWHDNAIYANSTVVAENEVATFEFTYNATYGTMVATLDNVKSGETKDVEGTTETFFLGTSNTYYTFGAMNVKDIKKENTYVGKLATMIEKSTIDVEEKLTFTGLELEVQTNYAGNSFVRLPDQGERYPEVSIAWSLTTDSTNFVLNGTKLTITEPASSATAKLTATLTCGETTKTVDFDLSAIKVLTSPADIVDAAYALEAGEALPIAYTLTGVITKIDSAYSSSYNNVSVIIAVEGKEDKPILCFRMKGEGADVIKVGDTITATGILKNYNGKIEFDAGCTLDSYTPGSDDPDTPVVPPVEDEYAAMTIPQALEAADTTKVKVSGTVCEINTVWNDQFNNITVTITDADGNKLYVYRLATKVELGDIVTIKGEMATYNGRQIGAGATAEITGKDNSYVYVEMTIPKALAAADGTNVIVTGTVSEIGTAYSEQYGNISVNIVDDANNVLYLYRLSGNVEVGNVIKVRGTMATYNGNRQLTGGTYELISEGEVTPPAGGEDPDTPVVDPNLPVMDEATAYKFFVAQNKVGVVYYLTGEVSTRYLATTVEPAEAVDVYAEKATGGYKFYIYVDNVKNYINIYMNESNKVSVNYAADSTCVYAYNVDSNCWYTTVAEKEYYLGTYNEFNTVSASETSYINAGNTGVSQFPMEYVVATEAKAPTAAEKIAYEKAKISITTAATGAATIELDTKIAVYDDVTITWALTESAIATLENNVLTITNPDEETKVTVTATITCGDESETAVFEIVVAHKDVNAAEPTAYSVSFANTANRTEFSSSKQVWVQNGVTITNEKASSTSNVADYANPARFYKSSSLTFAAKGMVKIEITCNNSSYATALANSISDANVTVTTNNKVVTITFAAATDSWTIATLGAQVRVDSLVVYAA